MRRMGIAVLGATGSVGTQALDVIAAFPERFRLVGLAANENIEALAKLIEAHEPEVVALSNESAARKLREQKAETTGLRIEGGAGSLVDLATAPGVDVVLAAVVGKAGLPAVLAAARASKRIALANKESLVMAGELVMSEARKHGATILPVDSEHAAAHQLLDGLDAKKIDKLILTASGGPFFGWKREDLEKVTVEQALAHPNWKMGAKISIDSATMMNKGFEVIEARWLFDLPANRIDVLIHPQSLVHAMVKTVDGSTLCQLSAADMRLPIAYALGYPERLPLKESVAGAEAPDLTRCEGLAFHAADEVIYPALALCREALRRGRGCAAALSVADETATRAFLEGRIGFCDITGVLTDVLEHFDEREIDSLEAVIAAGERGAELAAEAIERGFSR